jgi:hypothetical protein
MTCTTAALPAHLEQSLFQRRDVGDAASKRQAVHLQAGSVQNTVERGHHLLAQQLVRRVDQQPLEGWPVQQRSRQALKVVKQCAGKLPAACSRRRSISKSEAAIGQRQRTT